MNTIFVLSNNNCSLQNNVPEHIKELMLQDNVGSHFEEVDTWDETLKHPTWDNGVVVENTARLLDEARGAKMGEIITDHTTIELTLWSAEATDVMDKKKADTVTRISELTIKDSLTQDEQDELNEYMGFFNYAKTLNKEERTFKDEVAILTTVEDVEDYTYSFTPPPNNGSQSDDDLSDAEFFVKYGYNRDL